MADDAEPTTEDLLREIQALRSEMEKLRPGARRLRPHHKGRMRYVVHSLETDPDVQYKVHRWGAIYWLINFPLIVWLFFAHPNLWVKIGVFITLIYSIYANLATDYGAMSSAMAAKGMQPPPEIPLEDRSLGQTEDVIAPETNPPPSDPSEA